MSAQKFNLSGAEDNSPEVQTALEQASFLLYQSGAQVRTVNTQNEPIEPVKEFIEDWEKWIPDADTQKAIDQINAIAETVDGLEVVFIGGGGIKNPKR